MKLFCIVFLCVLSHNCFAGPMDGWDWFRLQSPYGSTFIYQEDEQGIALFSNEASGLSKVHEWYFYRGYTIGSYNKNSSLRYFVLNERRHLLRTFDNEQSWHLYLEKKSLKPFLTRWWRGNWEANELVVIYLAFVIYIAFTVLCKYLQRVKNYNYSFTFWFGAIHLIVLYPLAIMGYNANPQTIL